MTGGMIPAAAAGNRFREITAVRDGDGYVIGSPSAASRARSPSR
jgi:hypothetical protein